MTDTATPAIDDRYWREKLANPNARLPVTERPEYGYYRYRQNEGEAMMPVAFWYEGEQVCCQVGNDMMDDPKKIARIWMWACKLPVHYDDWLVACDGGAWPDDSQQAASHSEVADALASLGHNQPPAEDPAEELARLLAEEQKRVEGWIAESKGGERDCHQAANWIPDLRKLEARVEEAFEVEKKPIREQSNAIDEKWRPLKRLAAAIKDKLNAHYQKIAADEKKRLEKIAYDKAMAEAEERRLKLQKEREEREAREKEEAAALAAAAPPAGTDEPSMFDALPEIIPPAPAPETEVIHVVVPEVHVSFGGARANKIGVKSQPKQAIVTDYVAAAKALVEANNIDVKAAIDKAAQKIIKAGGSLPGVTAQ